MRFIELEARAKINLSLDVLRKRPDGYHDLKMIMQTVALHDDVRVGTAREGVEVFCSTDLVLSGRENIAYKAAALLISHCGLKSGVRIEIEKKIPIAAGLAGGSTDAAAVLKGMNRLFSLGLSDTDLMVLGKRVGADVPYCIKGGTALAEGIGEVLTELTSMPRVEIVLVKPSISVSTPWVYKNLDLNRVNERPDTEKLIEAIKNRDITLLSRNMRNVLETVTGEEYPIISEIKGRLMELGAEGSMMSGSGPTVFGIFRDKQMAQMACDKIKDDRWQCILTHTV